MADTSLARSREELASVADADRTVALNKVSWGGILAGAVLALTVQLLLNLLGVGIGAAVMDPGAADGPAASTLSILGGVWYAVAGLIGAFAGGYVSSRLSGRPAKMTGAFQGLTSWAVTTLVVLYLLTTSVGALIGGAFSGLSGVIGGFGNTAATVAQAAAPSMVDTTNPMADIERQIRSAGNGEDPESLRAAAVTAVQAALTGDQDQVEDARVRAAEALARAQNIPAEQARTQIDAYEAKYRAIVERAKQQAIDAADTATKVVSRGSLLGFAVLILGAIAAWFGGIAGTSPVARVFATKVRDMR
ncbi:MAG: hypothetical protein ACRC67_24490 [Inquilinus sp.]|uniref:hypothetical protein n=1 Tax=Inquilinus sp. TaxID=1932117 RepID=UPI003F392E62